MSRVSSLAIDFLSGHPADCARVLEQLPTESTCSLISAIKPGLAAPVMDSMVTSYGSECLAALDIQLSVSIIKEMKTPQAARLIRAMPVKESADILNMLPPHVKSNIHSSLRYPDLTVGRIMDSNPFSLPESLTVNGAIQRVKNLREQAMDEIFVVDDDHKLKGAIHVSNLLSATKPLSLQTILQGDVPYLSTRTDLNAAAAHAGWQTFSTLPVVGKDHILSGTLKSSTLLHVLAAAGDSADAPDALRDMFSMTKMYWIVLAELVNTMAGDVKRGRGRKD